jgi:hypothetical protein
MKNIPQKEFEAMLVALVGAANAGDPNIEEGHRIGQEWSPSSVEVKLRYVADIKKLEEWQHQKTFARRVMVTKVPCKIGHDLYWKDILAQVYDMGEYRRPPVKYELKK